MAQKIIGKVGFTPKGIHNSGISYENLDVVFFNGDSYVSLENNNATTPPSSKWQKLADKGNKGDKGDTGDTGSKGDSGFREVAGTVLPTATNGEWTWLFEGTYTQSGGSNIVVAPNKMVQAARNATTWTAVKTVDLPVVPPMGQVAAGDGRAVSGDSVFKGLIPLKQKTNALQNALVDTEFGIADEEGNVAFKVDAEGLTSFLWLLSNLRLNLEKVGFRFDEAGNVVINTSDIDWAKKLYDKGLLVTDEAGKIALKIDENGLETTKIKASEFDLPIQPNNWLYGKNIWSLGDSLAEGGHWQRKISELTGAIWKYDLNRITNKGGTQTRDNYFGSLSGFVRAKNLKKLRDAGEKVDVIFIENLNDGGIAPGAFNQEPYFESQTLVSDTVIPEAEDATTYVQANLASIKADSRVMDYDINSRAFTFGESGDFTAQTHTLLYVKKVNASKMSWKVLITTAPTSSGSFVINTAYGNYTVAVTAGQSIESIYEAILAYFYSRMTDTWQNESNHAEGVNFSYTDSSSTFSITWGSSGIAGTVTTETGGFDNLLFVYKSLNVSGWNTASNWVLRSNYQPENNPTAGVFTPTKYQMYKGLLEYLIKNFPESEIIWVCPTIETFPADLAAAYDSGNYTSYFYARGVLNYFYYYNNWEKNKKETAAVAADVCSKYACRVIELQKTSGINLFNNPLYYNGLDVHPKTVAYERWGETIVKELFN